VETTGRARRCTLDEASRVASAVATLALSHVSRDWLAHQLGRAQSLVDLWFAADKRHVPLALLVARRGDGRGFLLDDADFERVVAELRRYRGAR
jgi:hypothetical protein